MKRVKAACICQTLHFLGKGDVERDQAAALARQEVEHYKRGLERSHTRYRIVQQREEPDGSILVKVIR